MQLRRRPLIAAVGTLLLLGVTLVWYRSVTWARYQGEVAAVPIDLARPDALVRTRSLSQLPRDLLRVPLASDLLTEDLVFYYEEHPDRLGLKGSLRRIAYEHELAWNDELLAWVLDQPAEMALWRGGDGRLRHWALSLSRPQLVKVLQEAATVALNDRQLSLAGELSVDGAPVQVLAFEYSARRTLLLAGRGDRVVLLSDPGLLLDDARNPLPSAKGVLEKLLSADAGQRAVYGEAFQLAPAPVAHSVLVRAHYLSFGYQRFFPGLEALRFDFGEGGWSTHVLFDGSRLPKDALHDRELWAGLPTGPAACALLPVDWRMGEGLLEAAPGRAGRKPSSLAAELEGPAAVCWYSEGRLQAPLVAARLKNPRANLAPLFEALFDWSVAERSEEPKPLRARRRGDALVWQRTVEVPFATVNGDGEPEPGPLEVTLALKGRHVYFSPDSRRVDQALLTLAKRYPSVADSLPPGTVTLGVLSPRSLADLGRAEALVMLPRGQEPAFRDAAERLLLPRLLALGRHPAYRLALAGAGDGVAGWQAVEWQELAR